MKCYAQLNNDCIVIAISQLNDTVESENMIEIEEFDTTIIGKKFNKDTQEFDDVPIFTPTPSPDPQKLASDAIMAGIADLYIQQSQAMNAIMAGMTDLYGQIEELKKQKELGGQV